MERPDLATDSRLARWPSGHRAEREINAIVAQWTVSLSAEEIERRCVAHDVPVGTRLTARPTSSPDPHMVPSGAT